MLGFDDGHTNDAIKGLDEDEKATPLKIVGRNDFNGLRKDSLLVNEPVVQVAVHDGKPTVTSLQVAEAFGKEHLNVLRDISNLLVSKEFIELNFESNAYTDTIGRSLPMYRLTRDGFMILVMGYTGVKAMALKEAYIAEFNRMEAELANRPSIALSDFTDPAAKFH